MLRSSRPYGGRAGEAFQASRILARTQAAPRIRRPFFTACPLPVTDRRRQGDKSRAPHFFTAPVYGVPRAPPAGKAGGAFHRQQRVGPRCPARTALRPVPLSSGRVLPSVPCPPREGPGGALRMGAACGNLMRFRYPKNNPSASAADGVPRPPCVREPSCPTSPILPAPPPPERPRRNRPLLRPNFPPPALPLRIFPWPSPRTPCRAPRWRPCPRPSPPPAAVRAGRP